MFLFTLLMISREGMETALLLMQLHTTANLALGAALGVAGAAAVAWLWSRYGHRINLALFFQATAIFLFVFVVQLRRSRALHEMAEQHYLPYSEIIHARTESWGPDSAFGHLLTYLLVILPLGWVAVKALFSKRPVFQPPVVTAAPVARDGRAIRRNRRSRRSQQRLLCVLAISAVSSGRDLQSGRGQASDGRRSDLDRRSPCSPAPATRRR